MRPLIKWVGGKQDEYPRIMELIRTTGARYTRLIEPYCGPGGFLLSWCQEHPHLLAHASDANAKLIAWLTCIKSSTGTYLIALGERIREYQALDYIKRKHWYQALRARVNATTEHTVETAADFHVLMRTAYKGLYRVNASGGFNTSGGEYKDTDLDDSLLARTVEVSRLLDRVQLTCSLAERTLEAHGGGRRLAEDSLVYLDPPWLDGFDSYGGGTAPSIRALAAQARGWLDAGASLVAISNTGPLGPWLDIFRATLPKTRAVSWNRAKRLAKNQVPKQEVLVIVQA